MLFLIINMLVKLTERKNSLQIRNLVVQFYLFQYNFHLKINLLIFSRFSVLSGQNFSRIELNFNKVFLIFFLHNEFFDNFVKTL